MDYDQTLGSWKPKGSKGSKEWEVTDADRDELVKVLKGGKGGDPNLAAELNRIMDAANARADGDLKIGRHGLKAPLQWIPMWALQGAARVFDYGARKYKPGNWQKAAASGDLAMQDYISAAQRHWAAMQEADAGGIATWDAVDAESGLPHIDHLIASLLMTRGIAIKAGLISADPGKGNDPCPPNK